MGKLRRSFSREFEVEAVQLVTEPEWYIRSTKERAEARASAFAFIDVFSNRVRRHSALGCLPPVE